MVGWSSLRECRAGCLISFSQTRWKEVGAPLLPGKLRPKKFVKSQLLPGELTFDKLFGGSHFPPSLAVGDDHRGLVIASERMDPSGRLPGGEARAGGGGLAYNFEADRSEGAAFTSPSRPGEAGAHQTPGSGSQQGTSASQSSPGAYAHMPDYESCRSLITSYFYQITMGCGTVHCTNRNCFSALDGPRLDPTCAAILAVKLAQSTTHFLCAGAAITIPQSLQWVETPANSDVVPPRADLLTSCVQPRGQHTLSYLSFLVVCPSLLHLSSPR